MLHLFCYVVWGIYYGEYTDRFLTAYVDGSFSGGIAKPIFYNYGFNTAVSHLMALGYGWLPQFNWYGIVAAFFMLLTTTGFLWIANSFMQSFVQRKWLAAGMVLFLMPFWCSHVMFHRTTELGSLACGIGIVGLVVSFLPSVSQRLLNPKTVRAYFTVLILSAIFMRMEPTLMCTGIFLPYGLWVVGNRQAQKGLIKIAAVVLPVYLGAYMLYLGAIGPAEKIFRDTRVYTHTLWDFGQDEQYYHPTTKADSVKLEAALAYFISDEVMLSPAFYDSVGVIPLEKSLGSFNNYFIGFNYRVSKAIDVWQKLLHEQPLFFIAYGLALLFAFVLLLTCKQLKKLGLLLFMQLWFLSLLFGVTVFMKMELRVMSPLFTLNLIALTLLPILVLPSSWQLSRGYIRVFMLAMVFFVWPFVLKNLELGKSANNYKTAYRNIQAFKSELTEPQFNDRIIVFHSFAWQMLYGNLFDNNEFAQQANFLAIDNGEMYMYPQYKQAMEACCGGYTVKELVTYLLANKTKVVFVSDAERMDLMERYIEIVYNIPFNTKPAYPNSVLNHPEGGVMMPEYASHLQFSYYVFD